MTFTDNETLIKEYKKLLIDNGIKHGDIAAKLDMTKQAFSNYLKKKTISFNDMQRLLNVIGYDLDFNFMHRDNS